jgi:hypothetical protein
MAKAKKMAKSKYGFGRSITKKKKKKKSYMCTSTKTKISTKTKNLVYVLSLYTILDSDMLNFTVILVLFVLTENIKYIFL